MKKQKEIIEEDPEQEAPDGAAALAAENQELRQAIRMQHASDAVTNCFRSAGARSPKLMFETAKGRLQFDDSGGLLNAAAIVAEIQREFPEQFAAELPAASIDGGAGLNQPAMLTSEALAKMSPAEVAALDWSDVSRVLSR